MRSPTAAPDGVGSDALQSIDAGTQQQSSALDGVRRRDQPAAVLLNGTQLRQLLGFGHTKFWQLKRAGALDVLKAPLAGYYSRTKVERWLDGGMDEPTRRFLSSHKPRVSKATR